MMVIVLGCIVEYSWYIANYLLGGGVQLFVVPVMMVAIACYMTFFAAFLTTVLLTWYVC